MPLKKAEATKLPAGVYVIAIILFILGAYLIFYGASFWHKYYFNPPAINSSRLDMNANLEAEGLPNLNQLTAWSGLLPLVILGLFFIFAGISLLRKKNWARWITIVISLFVGLIGFLGTFSNLSDLPSAIAGLSMGIYLLIDKKTRAVFVSNKKKMKAKKEKQELKGLGGWLVLIQILFISGIPSYLFILLLLLSPVYSVYPKIWILILGILSVIALVLNILILFLMYAKRKSFLCYAIIFLCYDILITFLAFDIFLAIFNLILMGLIILYLIKSKRVKNTFIYK